jgi:hypothetical protein
MTSLKRFNTKGTKLSTAGVREMYQRIKNREINQGEAARIYGLGVVQVGRIARGESRAQETGANEDPVPNYNLQPPRAAEVNASFAEVVRQLEGEKAPSLYDSPPPPTDDEDQATAERVLDRLNSELRPTAKQQQISDELDNFEKGD